MPPAGRSLDLRVECAAVFAGGSVGAVARALLSDQLAAGGPAWPWATLLANLAGAALLGFVLAHHERPDRRAGYARPLIGTGLCGALTTFSTFQLELYRMFDSGAVLRPLLYLVVSVALGLVAVRAGRRLVAPHEELEMGDVA
jgi:CrcB protein